MAQIQLIDRANELTELARGVPAFIQGYQDQEDRKQKSMEAAAKLKADKQNRRTQTIMQAAKLAEMGYDPSPILSSLDGQQPDVQGQPPAEGAPQEQSGLMGQGLLKKREGFISPKQRRDRYYELMTQKLEQDVADRPEKRKIETDKKQEELAKSKRPSPDEYKAGTFGLRAGDANKIIDELSQYRASAKGSAESLLGDIPLIGEYVKPKEQKRIGQAERNFVNAILRRESGAAIAPSEFDSAEKQYFPRAGDPEEVLQQKAENRKLAIDALQSEGARAIKKIRPQKIKVTDGNEILEIDPADLKDAMRDGFKQVGQ